MRKFGFPTRSKTNQVVQPQKMVRGLKFWFPEVDGLHFLCGENRVADQLHGNRTADQHLHLRIFKKQILMRRLMVF